MASFRRRMGKWEVRVRRYNNKTIYNLLKNKLGIINIIKLFN